jgi:hypothetical protein
VLEVFRASEVWRLDLVGSVVDELGLNGSGAEALAGESSFPPFALGLDDDHCAVW